MTLSDYCREHGLTRADIAARLNVHPVTVSKWCTGAAMPQRRFWSLIQAVTEGKVDPRSFMPAAETAQ